MPTRAGFWIRLLAAVIDALLFLPVVIILGVVFALLAGVNFQREPLERYLTACLLLLWLMYSSMEIFVRGTLGKIFLGLRILAGDGEVADKWRLLLRWSTKQSPVIFYMLFELTSFPLFYMLTGLCNLFVLIGCLYASNDDKLTWHDQWAGTAVYHWRLAPRAGSGFAV